ncbi:hypothetical protein [Flavobacterium sp. GCM10023249]|uniref:hypothetical protein n=1 Tax=unclassified Flavobacterium TaxID=196869 RepID=UPI0036088C7D
MKKETIIKRIEAARGNGHFSWMGIDVINGNLVRPTSTEKHRRFGYYTDCRKDEVTAYLKLLKIDYILGNDAPRGGATGNYIKLSTKGMRQTKEYREWIKMDEAQRIRVTTINQILN